jgi:U11/U12 small nuclear ribonucleoprotein SNRNP25
MSMEDSQPPISSSLPTSDILISTSSLPPANLTSKPTVSDEDTKLSETQKMLQQLFQDPLLSDLTKYISNENNRTLFNKKNTSNNNTIDESSLTATINSLTLEQVDTLIALELGTAFEITVLRCGLEPLTIVVRQNATIADIKNLIVLQITRDLKEKGRRNKKIGWKYIWKTYCLMFEGKKLLEDKARIQEIGIRSGSILRFSRYVKAERKK